LCEFGKYARVVQGGATSQKLRKRNRNEQERNDSTGSGGGGE